MSQVQQTEEPSSSRLILSMAIAGFISGFIIIAIYLVTFETIKENKARELQAAVFKVLPGVSKMQKLHFVDNKLVVVNIDGTDDEMIFAGFDEQGQFVGYAIQGAGPGFQDTISLLYGYQSQGELVRGMEILYSRETPGLGDKIFKDMDFVNEFKKLSIASDLKAVKKGKKSKETEIDAITGATISSKAVVKIMNKAHHKWAPIIKKVISMQGTEPVWVEKAGESSHK